MYIEKYTYNKLSRYKNNSYNICSRIQGFEKQSLKIINFALLKR